MKSEIVQIERNTKEKAKKNKESRQLLLSVPFFSFCNVKRDIEIEKYLRCNLFFHKKVRLFLILFVYLHRNL